MGIKAVIWDVGGVLVRTEDYTSRDQLAANLGFTRMELEELVYGLESGRLAQLGEISVEEHWRNILRVLDLKPDRLKDLQESFWGGDSLDTELIDYIRSLRREYKTGLLSNAFPDLRPMVESVWKIADAFDKMIISSEVGLMKPDTRIYRLAVRQLGIKPSEGVFIDDFLRNIHAARSVDLHAIHFTSPSQAIDSLEELLGRGG